MTPARDPKGISRASSFAYHHRDHSMQAARSLGFLASANSRSSLALPGSMGIPQGSNPNQCPPSNNNNSSSSQSCKDLSQPLHVDCSVEYDLGNQPKIPKDSAPLLIIHPGKFGNFLYIYISIYGGLTSWFSLLLKSLKNVPKTIPK